MYIYMFIYMHLTTSCIPYISMHLTPTLTYTSTRTVELQNDHSALPV